MNIQMLCECKQLERANMHVKSYNHGRMNHIQWNDIYLGFND